LLVSSFCLLSSLWRHTSFSRDWSSDVCSSDLIVEMELFEKKFYESMSSRVALLNRITYYIVNRKGKQMRPMFVFLTAKLLNNGEIGRASCRERVERSEGGETGKRRWIVVSWR